MVDVPVERFEELVADALDEIPDDLWALVDNVAVHGPGGDARARLLLGLYEGVPLDRARRRLQGMVMPDRISIFRRPILARCADEAEVVEQVRITVIHEVAHHFGIDDERLHELGWA